MRRSYSVKTKDYECGRIGPSTPKTSLLAVALLVMSMASSSTDAIAQEGNEQIGLATARQLTQQLFSAGKSSVFSPWQDISSAPADFPAPLYRGTRTRFLKLDALEAMTHALAKSSRQISLQTTDAPSTVAQWYTAAFPSYGFKSCPASGAANRETRVIRAESNKSSVIVFISPSNTNQTATTQIQITVCAKQAIEGAPSAK